MSERAAALKRNLPQRVSNALRRGLHRRSPEPDQHEWSENGQGGQKEQCRRREISEKRDCGQRTYPCRRNRRFHVCGLHAGSLRASFRRCCAQLNNRCGWDSTRRHPVQRCFCGFHMGNSADDLVAYYFVL